MVNIQVSSLLESVCVCVFVLFVFGHFGCILRLDVDACMLVMLSVMPGECASHVYMYGSVLCVASRIYCIFEYWSSYL